MKRGKKTAILDDHSNVSLVRLEFFEMFDIEGTVIPYTLSTCAGTTEATGRRAHGFTIESVDGQITKPLPILIECNDSPFNRTEIHTLEAALHHQHLKAIAPEIPAVDADADVLLLLGRNSLQVHKVREQFNGPHNAPYVQRLDLGWVIIGDVCLGTTHKPANVNVLKTHVLENG